MWNVTHFLLVIGKDVMRLPFTKCAMSPTYCRSWEKMWWDYLSQNVQCHSHTVGHGKRCDETALDKMCNVWTHILLVIMGKDVMSLHKMCKVTHLLLVIGRDVMRMPFTKCPMSLTTCWLFRKDVMRLPFTKYAMTLTRCWSWEKMSFHKMCNITHFLLVIGKMWWDSDCLSQNVQCHSHPVSHRNKHDETAFHRMHNVTHSLLFMGMMWWECISQYVQCHSLPVGHKKRCDETAFHKNITYILSAIGKNT